MAGLCLWITVSRAGLAQDAKREAPTLPAPAEPGQIKPAERKDLAPPPATVEPGPAALPTAPSAVDPAPAGVAPPPEAGVPVPDLTSTPRVPASELTPADNPPPASRSHRHPFGTDDPEKDAQTFAEQNRKLAESQLKTLKDEEARLRARLQKVESGIKRWQALLEALKQSESVAAETLDPATQRSLVESEPLQPAPVEKAGERVRRGPAARSDRKFRPVQPADEQPVPLPEGTPKRR